MSTLPDPSLTSTETKEGPPNESLLASMLQQNNRNENSFTMPANNHPLLQKQETTYMLLSKAVTASAFLATLWLYIHHHNTVPITELIMDLYHQTVASVPARTALGAAQDAWYAYETVLRDAPIATKAVTSATVYTIGDILSQQSEDGDGSIDLGRMLRSTLAGLIGHGPLSHLWYNHLESLFSMWHINTEWWSFLPKVALDQTIWGPIWNNTYILLLGLMKRESIQRIVQDVKESTLPLITTGLKLWVPAHFITYGLIPVENRLLWVDLVEILWVSILASQAASVGKSNERNSSPDR